MSTDVSVNDIVERPKEQKTMVINPVSGGSWFDLVTVEKTLFVAGFMFVVLLWRRR